MSETKKYIGNGKSSQYSDNCQINLNQLFTHLYNDTKKSGLKSAFAQLKEALVHSRPDYIAHWTDKEGKENFAVKISVNTAKEVKFNQDKYITLNEWKPEQKASNPVQTESFEDVEEDDLPF